MGSESTFVPFRLFNFQIHHLIPEEIFGQFGQLLSRNGITLEMWGNKITVTVHSTRADHGSLISTAEYA